MDKVFKEQGLSVALETVILHLDAKSIASCRLVSNYLKRFIDERKSICKLQRNQVCAALHQALPKLNQNFSKIEHFLILGR